MRYEATPWARKALPIEAREEISQTDSPASVYLSADKPGSYLATVSLYPLQVRAGGVSPLDAFHEAMRRFVEEAS